MRNAHRDHRPRSLRWLVAVVLSSALVLSLASCGDSKEESTTPQASGNAGAETTVATKVGDTLNIGWTLSPPSLNPAKGSGAYMPFYYLAYDPLVILNADGSYAGGLATKFGYVGTGNKTYELTLRDGVTFSDGAALTADGVKQWLEYEKTQAAQPALFLGAVDTIEVTSPMSLRLNLSRPDPNLTFAFSQSVSGAGFIPSPAVLKDASVLNSTTVGAGPYMLDPSATVAGDHYTYVANPTYWNKPQVYWKRIVLRVIGNENSMVQALIAGQIQIAWGSDATLPTATAKGAHVVGAPLGVGGLHLVDRAGTVSKPLGDVKVRQALNHAIDRKAIVNAVFPGSEVTQQYTLKGQEGFDPDLENTYSYDPALAKKLLTDAGYGSGFTLSVLSSPLVNLDTEAQAIAGYLEKVGVKLDIKSVATAQELGAAVYSKQYPAYVLSLAVANTPQLYSTNIAPFGFGNPFGAGDPMLDELWGKYAGASPSEQPALAKQLNRRLVSLAWDLPIFVQKSIHYHNNDVTGLEITVGNAAVPYFVKVRPA